MAHEFRRRRRVEFAETDLAGIVHFSVFYRYMEETEHAFLRSLDLGVHLVTEEGTIGFPRLASRCEHLAPLRFEDEVDIRLTVARKGRTSLTYQFELSRAGELVARGELVAACCRFEPSGRARPVKLPEPYAGRIEEAPGEPLSFRRSSRSRRKRGAERGGSQEEGGGPWTSASKD